MPEKKYYKSKRTDPRGAKKKYDSKRTPSRAFTVKEEIFCREYIVDFNATRAARAAGYEYTSAGRTGYALLQKEKIKNKIDEVKEKLAENAGITPLRILLELKKIAFSNTADYFESWMSVKDFNEIPEEQKAALADIKVTKKTFGKVTEEFVQIKMHDKLKALDAMVKMLGYNEPEKVQKDINVQNIPLIEWVNPEGEEENPDE
jgi:phage terminase small subunit